ncbi:MAG TPA: nucleotide exchange factor GrpE [Firmicutes bacterium]|nr:nucleotide exchange factor GrpE [Bacillota bacterium]
MDQEKEQAAPAQEPAEAAGETAAEKTEEKPKDPKKEKASKPKKKDETAVLQAELEVLHKQLDEQKDQYQRMLAEYANYKRRTEQEKAQLGSFVKAETLKALLPALDNLERAVAAPAGDEYKKGVDMTIRQLQELLASQGLEAIDAQGAPFDPEIHHAVMREDADGVEPDTVTEMFQKGYKVDGRVVRPAMVKVAN